MSTALREIGVDAALVAKSRDVSRRAAEDVMSDMTHRLVELRRNLRAGHFHSAQAAMAQLLQLAGSAHTSLTRAATLHSLLEASDLT